jgi:2-methylcitrate dehydratase PrpD
VSPDEIESITVAARSLGRTLVFHPTDLVGMAHSLPYFVAAAIVDRTFGWEHATPGKLADPVIAALQDRVRINPDAGLSAAVGRTCGGSVQLTTRSGRTYSSTVEAPRGSSERGIEWQDVETKYRTLLTDAHIARTTIDASLQSIHELEQVKESGDFTSALRPP